MTNEEIMQALRCCDSSRWEWRGFPEAPEEGGKV